MKNGKWTRIGRFWAGALCAALWTWLAFALCYLLLRMLYLSFDWGFLLAVPLAVASLVAILFGAGVFVTYFWVAINDCNPDERWGELAVFIILSPLLLLKLWGIIALALAFAFLLAILPFDFGRDWGEEVWEKRRWRHLADLANDWEREENQR